MAGTVPRIYTLAGASAIGGEEPDAGFSGDGGPAVDAKIDGSGGLAEAADGSLLIAGADRVRRVRRDGRIVTVAGTGVTGFTGDGGKATRARIYTGAVMASPDGGFVVGGGDHLRKVDAAGVISTLASSPLFSQASTLLPSVDGGLVSLNCGENGPFCVNDLSFLATRSPDGALSVVAGQAPIECAASAPPIPAAAASFAPTTIATRADGTVLVMASEPSGTNACVIEFAPSGEVHVVAGGGREPDSANGVPATSVGFETRPPAVAWLPDGGFLVLDDITVRRVDPSGVISTVAGCTGDNCTDSPSGPATSVRLSDPLSIATAADGSFYVAEGSRIDHIAADGTLSQVSGTGARRLAIAPDGTVFAIPRSGNRVVRVEGDGSVTTVAGGGTSPYSSGAPATTVDIPTAALAVVGDGSLVVGGAESVFRFIPGGAITTVTAHAGDVGGLAVLPDGSVVVDDVESRLLQRVVANGKLEPFPFSPPLTGHVLRGSTLQIRGVAALMDGGLAVLDGSTIVDAGSDGVIRRVIAIRSAGTYNSLATAPDDGFYVSRNYDCPSGCRSALVHVDGNGTITTVARRAERYRPRFWGTSDGEPAIVAPTSFTASRAGGLLFSSGSAVHVLVAGPTSRLAVAITSETLSLLKKRRVAYRSTVPAKVELTVKAAGGKVVGRVAGRAHAGLNRLRLPRGLASGQYEIDLDARTSDGQATGSLPSAACEVH